MSQSDPTLAQALALHQAGRLRDAEQLYRQAVTRNPKNFDALRYFGVCRLQQGDASMAGELLGQAVKLKPRHADALFELGQALYARQQFQAALDCFDKAIKAKPVYPEALNARGIMLSALGRHQDAIASYEKAVRMRPDFAQAHSNLGNGLGAIGRHEDALASYERALTLQPNALHAQIGRGNTLLMLDRHEEALVAFDNGLAVQPNSTSLLNGRGSVLAALLRNEEALACFQRTLTIDTNDADAHHNMGNILARMNQIDEAMPHYQEALRLRPGHAETLMQQGKWLARYKRHIEALACYDQLLAIQPGNYKAHSHRGEALVALGRHADGLDAYRRALTLKPDHVGAHVGIGDALRDLGQHEAAIAAFDRAIAIFPDNPDLLSGALFNINYSGSFTPAEILARHRHYGELVEIPLRANWQVHTNTPDPARPIRVGFVSGDLRRHPVGYFMENVFHELAKAPLELYAYANQPQDDDLTARIRPCFKCWRDIFDHTDDSVATQIRADGIDILVDLSGHTGNHRLKVFARKPAPVQVTYLGYFASTGLSAMDYILGNRWLMPDGDPEQYTERPYRLPDAHLCFTPPSLDIAVKPPPALANGYVTFGNFNALAKMTDNVVACWADILHAVPDSRLLLKSPPLDATDVREQVLQRFAVHGIADDRLLLEGRSDYANYFACYHKLDIALDPFPYNGGTTTADALWMGVPVLTLQGDRYVARMGTSILKILDLPEWVASSQDDYVARAARLAADVQALATLRAGLRERFVTSPLCDAPRFAANLERAFRDMWQAWCTKPGFGFTRGEP